MRVSNVKAMQAIRDCQPFDNHSSTLGGRSTFIGLGRTPWPYDDVEDYAGRIVFWIYSYDTPIAFKWDDGTWYMPPVHYSTTTERQQLLVAEAIGYDFRVEQTVRASR